MEPVFQQPLSDDVWAAVWVQSTFHIMLYSAVWCGGVNLARYSLWTSDITVAVSKKSVHCMALKPLWRQVLDINRFSSSIQTEKSVFKIVFICLLFCCSSFTWIQYLGVRNITAKDQKLENRWNRVQMNILLWVHYISVVNCFTANVWEIKVIIRRAWCGVWIVMFYHM